MYNAHVFKNTVHTETEPNLMNNRLNRVLSVASILLVAKYVSSTILAIQQAILPPSWYYREALYVTGLGKPVLSAQQLKSNL